jgi:hypothetical protein
VRVGYYKTRDAAGEKGSKRRKIIYGVVGAVAAVGAGLVVYKVGYDMGHSDGLQDAANNAPKGGGTPPPEVAPPAPEVHHATVHSGDNAWKLVNEATGNNQDMTNSLFNNGQVSVTDAAGHVRTDHLELVYAGDTVNFTMPQPTGAGAAAHEAAHHAANANVEVLPEYNSQTGAGTVSGATLDHLHHLNIDVPTTPGVFHALYDRVADYNHLSPEQLTHMSVGQEVHFPPQEEFNEWIRQLNEAANKTTTTTK